MLCWRNIERDPLSFSRHWSYGHVTPRILATILAYNTEMHNSVKFNLAIKCKRKGLLKRVSFGGINDNKPQFPPNLDNQEKVLSAYYSSCYLLSQVVSHLYLRNHNPWVVGSNPTAATVPWIHGTVAAEKAKSLAFVRIWSEAPSKARTGTAAIHLIFIEKISGNFI